MAAGTIGRRAGFVRYVTVRYGLPKATGIPLEMGDERGNGDRHTCHKSFRMNGLWNLYNSRCQHLLGTRMRDGQAMRPHHGHGEHYQEGDLLTAGVCFVCIGLALRCRCRIESSTRMKQRAGSSGKVSSV